MSRVWLRHNGSPDWVEVVTDSAEDVRFNFVLDDLENPTNYVSESSYSLKLPRCPENNRFFGQFCRLDSVIVAGGYDPTHKMQYRVLDSAGMLISTGDAVVSEINSQCYILSLVGSQARLFSMLLNSGWDTVKAVEDSTYHLLDEPFDSLIVNKNAVYTSWLVDYPLFDLARAKARRDNNLLRLYYNIDEDTNVTENLAWMATLIGFAPTAQGKYKDFESDTWYEYDNTTIPHFLPVFCNTVDSDIEPVQKVAVTDGTLDLQMGEYRSYYQQPFIYLSALWQLIRDAFPAITDGYTLNLDPRWFDEGNTDLQRLVYMLPMLNTTAGEEPIETSLLLLTSGDVALPSETISGSDPEAQVSGLSAVRATATTPDGVAMMNEVNTVTLSMEIEIEGLTDTNQLYYFNPYNPLYITIYTADGGDTLMVFPLPSNGVYTEGSISSVAAIENMLTYAKRMGWSVVFPIYDAATDSLRVSFDYSLRTTPTATLYPNAEANVRFYNDNVPIRRASAFIFTPSLSLSLSYFGKRVVTKGGRSLSSLTFERLFGSIRPAEVLLKYTKERHLLWKVDDLTRTVLVIRAQDYFADCFADGVADVTDHTDTGREYRILPLSWDSHAVVFNLDDPEADGVQGYEERHGIGYGSKKLITANSLNNASKELLEGITASAMYSQVVVAPRVLAVGGRIPVVELPPMPINVSGGESADISGNFYYRTNNASWPYALLQNWQEQGGAGFVYLTDDLQREVFDDRYCWEGSTMKTDAVLYGYALMIAARPVFRTVSDGGLSVLFAPVREQYTTQPDQPTAYLYERCWQNYIEEVYNAQNKTLEAYIHLPRKVFDTVRNNPFVRIGDMVYLMTYIKGWGEHNTHVRCTLRQITDINNLTQ